MENNELSIKISASMDKAMQSLNKLIPKIKETDNVVNRMLIKMDKNGDLTHFTAELRSLDSEMSKVTKTSDNFKNAFNLGTTFAIANKIFKTASSWMKKSTDYSESLNLFNVVLDDASNKAIRFQNIMNEAFGTNQAETLTRQGLYQSMAENMGIASDYAYIMSENTTKLVNDIASLYNKDENTVAEALRAGIYAGQTKPLRSFGMDITEKTLQPELDRLGIDRTVRDLSQAEKQLLRYISVLRQSKEAQGDWANTIEAPANQLKILGNQATEASKALANLFIGAFGSMLPYANAILMVIEEVANALATMFGIEISDYNTGIADMSDAFIDVEDSIDGATGSAKELRRQILGFDQVNNINDNKNSGSGGASVSGGIDQRLLDAITGYDNGMESVRMKAVQIRDNIMEWLGFTKEIDPLTGKVSFSLRDGYSNFKLIVGLVGTLMGYKILTGITNLFTGVGKLSKILGTGGLLKNLKNLIAYQKIYTKLSGSMTKGIISGTGAFIKNIATVNKVSLGLIGLTASTIGAYNSFRNLDSETKNTGDALLGLTLSTGGAIASGALLGSTFGPLGTIIGATAGGVVALTTALLGYAQEQYEIKKMNELFDEQGISINILSDEIVKLCDNSTKYITAIQDLSTEYYNSKSGVDEARESLDKFLTNLDLQDKKISESQLSQLKTYYDNLKIATEETNEASKNYYVALIKRNAEASNSSKETTANQIADYLKLQSTYAGYQQEYIDKEYELTVAKEKGKISSDEYKDSLEKLKTEYGLIADTSFNAEGAINNFTSSFKDIDYSSVDNANNSIQTTIDKYNETIGELENYKTLLETTGDEQTELAKKTIENLDLTKLRTGVLTEQQQKIYDTAVALVNKQEIETEKAIENVNSTITELQGQYKGYLSSIYADMVIEGVDTTSAFKDTVTNIKKELKGLKDVEMTGIGKTMFQNIIKGIDGEDKNLTDKVSKIFSNLGVDSGGNFIKGIKQVWKEKQGDLYENTRHYAWEVPNGYSAGINDKKDIIEGANSNMAKWGENSFKKYTDTHSPSGLYKKLGQYLVEGLILGINSEQKDAVNAIKELLEKMQNEFNKAKFTIKISSNAETTFNSILTKLQTFVNRFRNGINSLLSGMTTSMNNVSVGKDNKIYYKSMPQIYIPKFANGGFPEDGLFYANHTELVGQFSNGKTAVANNEMIIDGIKAGVYEAVSMAMSNVGGASVDINVRAEEGIIVEKAVNGIQQHVIRTGELPFTVPV